MDFLDNILPGRKKQLDPDIASRIPPGQYRTEKWPVLHYGSVPRINTEKWSFRIFGLVDQPVTLDWEQFMALPKVTIQNDIHCVTRWSKLDNTWEGVAVRDVMKLVGLKPNVKYVLLHAANAFTANLSMEDFDREENLFAYKHDGEALTPEHGYPLRLVVPHLYFWKSAKWIQGMEFLDRDRPGFWESYGYHMHGDPWTEERFG